MPRSYAILLAHDQHMTVTVEQFHDCRVDVQVLTRSKSPTHYARKILLSTARQRPRGAYGIMRVNLAYLEPGRSAAD